MTYSLIFLFYLLNSKKGNKSGLTQRHYIEPLKRFLEEEIEPSLNRRASICPQLLKVDYPQAEKVKLLCDKSNTHSIASLYKAFPAPEAHSLARRLEIYHTPGNGSLRSGCRD